MVSQWMKDIQRLLDARGVAANVESKDGIHAVVTYKATLGVCTYTDLMRIIPANVDSVGYWENDDTDGGRFVTAHLRIDVLYIPGFSPQKSRPRHAEKRTTVFGNLLTLVHPSRRREFHEENY